LLSSNDFPVFAMTDDTMRVPRDAQRISLAEEDEVAYWTRKFAVSRERLEEAVEAVGHGTERVGIYLDEDAVAKG
jgi:hypothetical protein